MHAELNKLLNFIKISMLDLADYQTAGFLLITYYGSMERR